MIVAQEKKKNNIAEYLLYMWQVEDFIRAHNFDIDSIYTSFISRFSIPEDKRAEIKTWYSNLAIMMVEENVSKSGHLQFLTNQLNDLIEFHHTIIKNRKDKEYIDIYANTRPIIAEYSIKTNLTNLPEIEVCFVALYSILLLKLQKKQISKDTMEGTVAFSKLLAMLSKKYHLFEQGKISFEDL